MWKPSLRKFNTSTCPVRLSFLGHVGEVPQSNMRQSQSNTTRSRIPLPIRKRSQSSPQARDAAKHVITASVRHSCSSSSIQHIESPVTPMCWSGSIPQTAQPSRSNLFGSRDRGLSSKPVLKDPGHLSDKQVQNAAVQKVHNYFLQVEEQRFQDEQSKRLKNAVPDT